MAPRRIRPDQIAEVLPAGGLTWLQACSGESPLIREGLVAAGEALGAMTFTGIFVPGLNRVDYVLGSSRRVKTFFMTPELARAPDDVEFLPLCYRGILAVLRATPIDAALLSVSTPDEQGMCSFGPVVDFLVELWPKIPVRIAHRGGSGLRIVALPATADRGATTRIVAPGKEPGPVSLGRFDIDVVVTEFGIADLRGKGYDERAEALMAIAAPRHQATLAMAWSGWRNAAG